MTSECPQTLVHQLSGSGETGDVARTSLEAGNSPKMVFRHYHEIVDEEAAKAWFSITPIAGWQPPELQWSVRERLRKFIADKQQENR